MVKHCLEITLDSKFANPSSRSPWQAKQVHLFGFFLLFYMNLYGAKWGFKSFTWFETEILSFDIFLKNSNELFCFEYIYKKMFFHTNLSWIFFFFFTFFSSFTPFLFLVLPCGPVSMKSSGALTNDWVLS